MVTVLPLFLLLVSLNNAGIGKVTFTVPPV
jgi:hypothetical protein